MKKASWLAILLLSVGIAPSQINSAEPTTPSNRSAKAAANRSAKKVVAEGTIEPVNVADVCSQLSDKIVSLGTDSGAKNKTIDYGSVVDVGTVLAQLDNVPYTIHVEQEQAGCLVAEAELAQEKIKQELAEVQWKRAESLVEKGMIKEPEYIAAKYQFKLSKASVAAAEASLAKKKADLKAAQLNLSYTTLKSPIKGVVIARRANVGQLANAGPNVPSLFLIADISKLEIWASVNEADISRIHLQQPVRFTIAAFPGKVFEGNVKQIRQNATMIENTVVYTVVITISNSAGTDKLLPYMTAHVEFAE